MKKILLVALLWVSATPVFAEQQISLKLTLPETQQIVNVLATQPWRDVNPLLQKIIEQVKAQTKAEPKPKVEPGAEPNQ